MKEEPNIEYEIKPKISFFPDWKDLWHFRELFYFFTWRDIKVKYKQTVLGFLWAVLQPLLLMIVITFFFGRTLKIPSQDLPYPVFVFSGLILWNMFSTGLISSSNSMINNATIIKKIYFPRLIIPVSSILGSLFDTMMTFFVFLPFLLIYRQPISLTAIWCWPVAILIGVNASLGLGVWLSALNIKYRDFRYVIPFVVQVLFFLTPVIYPASLIGKNWIRYLLAANPMHASIELFRYPLSENIPDLSLVWISITTGLIFLIVGLAYFRNTENYFSDLV